MPKFKFVYKLVYENLWVVSYGGIKLGHVSKGPGGFYAIRDLAIIEKPRFFNERQKAAMFLRSKKTAQRVG